ncbi:MAG TPA: class I SAM-dependent methyltransferase [Verrucomicrobiae bacterium]|nr:class I SAM-dependent methyltransferase [Verrucomicrobiae bacterium]
MTLDVNLQHYYARRASEYEKIFAKPERQQDLASLRTLLRKQFAGHDVLEVACGTGYWTQFIGESARSILATDINEEVLEIARHKTYANRNVEFKIADAFTLDEVSGAFTAGFAGFWWSHLPKSRIPQFLDCFHSKLRPRALVLFLDNNYVEGSSTRIAREDSDGNTYQKRKLENGAEFEVLKNFPREAELKDSVSGKAANVVVTELKYYWCLRYTLG